jgi:hypothetical protein
VAKCDEAGAMVDYPTDWGEPFAFRVRETPEGYQHKT